MEHHHQQQQQQQQGGGRGMLSRDQGLRQGPAAPGAESGRRSTSGSELKDGTQPAEAEYLSSRCVLFTYFQGEIGDVVDEHFSRALISPLGAPSPPFFFLSVRFVPWLQRLNLLSKHTKSHMCKSTQDKNPRTFFTVSQTLNVFWATFSLSESKGELHPTWQPAPMQQISD